MPQTDTVTNELHAITAGLGRAQTIVAALDNEAEKVAVRAVGAGFTAIAAGMAQVRTAVDELRARLRAATDAVRAASTCVTSARTEASPEQVVAALSPATDRIDAAQREVTAALGRADDIHGLVTRVLQGGNPGALLSMLDDLKQTLAPQRQRADRAKKDLAVAVTEARQLGEPGN